MMGLGSDVLYGLDTPRALLFGALAGKPGSRRTGREMLQDWGAVGENRPGLDAPDVAGFLLDVLGDPVNVLGGFGAAKGLKAAAKAAKAYQAGRGTKLVAGARASLPLPVEPSLATAVGLPAVTKVRKAPVQAAKVPVAPSGKQPWLMTKEELDATRGPVPEGTVRLYRIASEKYVEPPAWVKADENFQRTLQASGRYYTDDPSTLQFYVDDVGEGYKLVHKDVPIAEAKQYRVSNIPLKEGGKSVSENPRAFSRDPETEFFLPAEKPSPVEPSLPTAVGLPIVARPAEVTDTVHKMVEDAKHYTPRSVSASPPTPLPAAPSLAEAVGMRGEKASLPTPLVIPKAPNPSLDRVRTFAGEPVEFEHLPSEGGLKAQINVRAKGKDIGVVEIRNDPAIDSGSKWLFPDIVKPDDKVYRLQGIGLFEPPFGEGGRFKKTGVGREMWRRAFAESDDGWLANSQLGFEDDRSAVASLKKLADAGRIELHWKGGEGGNFVARLTDKGRRWVRGEIPNEMRKSSLDVQLVMGDYAKRSSITMRDVETVDDFFERMANWKGREPIFSTNFKIGNTRYEVPQDAWNEIYEKYLNDRGKNSLWSRGGHYVGEAERRRIVTEELLPLIKSKLVAIPESPATVPAKATGTALLKKVANVSPEEQARLTGLMREGENWVAKHYRGKLDPATGNVINPESGLRLWKSTKAGQRDLRKMLAQRTRLEPGYQLGAAAEYIPKSSERNFIGMSGQSSPVARRGIDYSLMRLPELSEANARRIGVHESTHYLTDAQQNMDKSLLNYVRRVNDVARRGMNRTRDRLAGLESRFIKGKGTKQRISRLQSRMLHPDPLYATDPTELLARVAATRQAMETAGTRVLQGGAEFPQTQELLDALGPKLTKHLLKMLPAVPLAAALGVGAGNQR